MQTLNRSFLQDVALRQQFDAMQQSPVTILQIGEGNFLRGFFDWMIHEMRRQGLYGGSVAVTQPRPSGKAKLEQLKSQDGIYNLVVRGIENGEKVEKREVISVFSNLIDPYSEWTTFLELADQPQLQFVVSNTTEAGLEYRPEPLVEEQSVQSFPGKLTLLLYRRFQTFSGDPGKGLIMLPCELVEGNGDVLRSNVIRYCVVWGLPESFQSWVADHNRFLNTLVDRIVTGYPQGEAENWFESWGYRDEALSTAEPYHFFAIEGEPELDEKLPLAKAGLNVQWVKNLTEFRLRKVRLLNGAHTLMTPLSILYGLRHVMEVMEHDEFGNFVRNVVEKEIIPTIPMPEAELKEYSDAVMERFLNPFIRHRLSDIALNSISKFKTRLLPSLLYYPEHGLELPRGLTLALAGLLRYYRIDKTESGYFGVTLAGEAYQAKDGLKILDAFNSLWKLEKELSPTELANSLLSSMDIWDADLSNVIGLPEAVAKHWNEREMCL